MPTPTFSDVRYFEGLASLNDTVHLYNSVSAPTDVTHVITSGPVPHGIYEVVFNIRITTGANPTLIADNYELRVQNSPKFRVLHDVQDASISQVLGMFYVRVRVPQDSHIRIFPRTSEVADSTIAAQINYRKVGDYIA